MQKVVSMAKLLGGIGDFLGEKLSVPRHEEIVVVPSSSVTPPSPFTDSLSVDLGSSSMFRSALGSPVVFSQPEKSSGFDKLRTTSPSLPFEAYPPCWAITRDSLLSEVVTT
ncbi:unnamed protein product [Lactuca saligna]|uniref:Uncharacterized protein n=1 Tax=Lactuca saligna TaxID=75948 RepID=A0AA35YMI9_LACSI|nr:unnamed protein product [Lactuca saligna]